MTVDFGFTRGDVVIVTGAGSGIGRATAIAAAQMGLAVAIWDISAEGAAHTLELVPGKAVAVTADVADPSQVEAALDASAALGPLRYLVNNAGPASASEREFDEALVLSVGSVRRVTTSWLSRPSLGGRALVNVASVAGNHIGTSPDWYPAAKAAIMGYTRHLAAYRSADVRANAVAPGMIDTPRLQGFAASEIGQRAMTRIPLHRLGKPEEIAYAILFLLSPLASYTNGTLLTVDGGWTVTQ